ncbi:SIS domain-containing protein [Stutzerimonas kunmingensis]|uniref:KpsF/GutQ family sugar-phosphate isomerase n=1 Tax=Stutzerimonas stutzeri subgroup TaxID=578833 RepID=UPI0009BD40B0|nr:KpsF/GutQ family sugar-phosphate isomerase [Stutzerimonas stutzeri]
MTRNDYIETAKGVFAVEAQAVNDLAEKLDGAFSDAVERILASQGRVIVCGMGKSGIIGKKIAATLASTGTPSFFMHPGEAYHGDLGMVTVDDVFIAISNSGETDEVIKLIPFLKDNCNYLVAFTGNPGSTLARASDAHLNVGVREEACPLQLAPTSSTTATLAMGDALAVTLMRARNFQPEHFARFHPGGSLGRRLLSRVEDEMYKGALPFVSEQDKVLDVIKSMTGSNLGLAIVESPNGWCVVTDGDIRRAVERYGSDVFDKCAADFMSSDPAIVRVGTRVEDALVLMDKRKITSLLVQGDCGVVGIFKK